MTDVPPQRGWLLQTWEDEAVAFDTASGDTHYLPPLTSQLYAICRDHPGLTAVALAERLAARLATTPDAELRAAIDESLASLHRIGLLRKP